MAIHNPLREGGVVPGPSRSMRSCLSSSAESFIAIPCKETVAVSARSMAAASCRKSLRDGWRRPGDGSGARGDDRRRRAWREQRRAHSDSCHHSTMAPVDGDAVRAAGDCRPCQHGPPAWPAYHRAPERPRRSAQENAMHSHVPASEPARRRWLRAAPDSIIGCAKRRGRPAWSEFMHILWSMWVFIVPVFSPEGHDRRWWALTLVSYPLFVALYTAVLLAPSRRTPFFALGMVALCLVLVPWYPSGMSYFLFGCIFLGGAPWRRWWSYPLALVGLNVLFVVVTRSVGYPWPAMVWLRATWGAVGVSVQLRRVLEGKQEGLQLSQDEVRRLAAGAERERIGGELHALPGHTLSLVALKADLAGKLLARDPQ